MVVHLAAYLELGATFLVVLVVLQQVLDLSQVAAEIARMLWQTVDFVARLRFQ